MRRFLPVLILAGVAASSAAATPPARPRGRATPRRATTPAPTPTPVATAIATPTPTPGRPYTLAEALTATVERSPEIGKARAAMAGQAGAFREARGAFDLRLRLSPSVQYTESSISLNSRLRDFQRRTQLDEANKAFAELRRGYVDAIQRHIIGPPVCPGGYTTIRVSDLVNVPDSDYVPPTQGLGDFLCVPLGLGSVPDNARDIQQQAQDLALIAGGFFSAGVGTPGASLDYSQRLNDLYNLGLNARIEEARQAGFELLEQGRRVSEEAEIRTALALERAGRAPVNEFRRTAALRLELIKPLRFGTVVTLQASVDGVENNARIRGVGKPDVTHRFRDPSAYLEDIPNDPIFGGKGIPNEFHSGLAVIVDQPLGKGRGARTAAAPERAAEADLEAARLRYQHTVSQRMLSTHLAYADLVAAQQTLALQERSAEANRQTREATAAFVRAGEKARSELDRIEARLAESEAAALGARMTLLQAREDLGRAMGIAPEEAALAYAVDDFIAADTTVDVEGLIRQARERRADVRAVRETVRGSEILLDATRADQKWDLDLQVRAGIGSFYQGAFFRVLPDERLHEASEPRDRPVNYYSPRGWLHALSDSMTPNLSVKLTLNAPFGNNTAKGRLMQARSTLRQDEIRAINLARVVDENVFQAAGSLRQAAQELAFRREAAARYESTWNDAQTLLRAGDLSLIDALTTEQSFTSARQQFVAARRDYEAALARFRFETGTLVRFTGDPPGTGDASGPVAR